jgi:4-hydroxy-2-oxoglutarate aldolase
MKSLTLRGIYAPITTPFTTSGDLDRGALEGNIRAHLQHRLTGIVVGGSTGEAALLDEGEREQLVQWSRPLVSGRLLIAGIGAESTRATLRNAQRAAAQGADAVLVVAPHYFGSNMTDAALRAHYLRVADDCELPVILYNIPKYMHFRISPALVKELAAHENIVGIKDSTGDAELLRAYLESQSARFTVLTGNGTFVRSALEMGARGGVIAASLFATSLTIAVAEAVERHDDTMAVSLQNRLTPLARIIVGEMGPPGIKAALDNIGLRGGAPRLPLQSLSGADQDRVRQLLRDAELPVAA